MTYVNNPRNNFHTYLDVRESHDGAGKWELLEPLVYKGNRDRFMVPVGFKTDFASVPKALRSFVSRTGKHTKAAVLHDWLYWRRPRVETDEQVSLGASVAFADGPPPSSLPDHQPITRKDADRLFRRAMKECGVGWFTRNAAYAAVRAGGWKVWNDRKEVHAQ